MNTFSSIFWGTCGVACLNPLNTLFQGGEWSEDVHLQNWQLWSDKTEDKSNQCYRLAPDSLISSSCESFAKSDFLSSFTLKRENLRRLTTVTKQIYNCSSSSTIIQLQCSNKKLQINCNLTTVQQQINYSSTTILRRVEKNVPQNMNCRRL